MESTTILMYMECKICKPLEDGISTLGSQSRGKIRSIPHVPARNWPPFDDDFWLLIWSGVGPPGFFFSQDHVRDYYWYCRRHLPWWEPSLGWLMHVNRKRPETGAGHGVLKSVIGEVKRVGRLKTQKTFITSPSCSLRYPLWLFIIIRVGKITRKYETENLYMRQKTCIYIYIYGDIQRYLY